MPPLPQKPASRPAGTVARQPVVVTNLVGALVLETCILLREFGVPLTEGQQSTINAVATLLILLGAALIARTFATPLSDPRDGFGRSLTPDLPTPGPRGPIGGGPSAA